MDEQGRRRLPESKSDSETTPDNRQRLQRSLESSVECIDVDIEPCGSNNGSNGNRITQRRSLNSINSLTASSGESGIDLTRSIDSGGYSTNDRDDETADDSDIENVPQSTPRTSRPQRSIKLKIPIQLFKIDLEKVDNAIDKKDPTRMGETKTNNDRIAFMIEVANPKPKRKRGHHSKRIDSLNTYVPQSYKGCLDSTSGFKLEFYYKHTYRTDDETQEEMKNLHKLRFLHRSNSRMEEIFALPSGSGRSVVLQWADTNFSLSIASATLDGGSVTGKNVKNLHENRYLTNFKMKKGESLSDTAEFHLRFAPQIYTQFHANINGDNSELKQLLGHNAGSNVKMQVQLESILFPGVVIDVNQYAELCGKLSAIYNNPDLPRSRKFDGYLSKVPKNRKTELEQLLLQHLWKYFRSTSRVESTDVFGKLKNFSIVQRESTRYYEASSYHVHYKTKMVQTFNERPQLQNLYPIVNKKFSSNSFNSFTKEFDALKISTPSQTGGERSVKEKLINCLEGVLYDDAAEKNYWRVNGEWYEVSPKYSFEVYAEYVRVLKASLLPKDQCSLKHLWPLKADRECPEKADVPRKKYEFHLKVYRQSRFVLEGIYNKLYADDPHFVVTDNDVAPFGVEICDLFECIANPVDASTLHLHHVKKAMGADGYRVALSQILCSAYLLRDCLIREDHSDDSAAFKFFKFIKKNQKPTMPVYVDYKQFLDQLRKATFVFSPIFESGDRELDRDYLTLLKYDFSDIEDEIDVPYRECLEKELKAFLLASEYIYAADGVFTPKWFDACAVVQDRGFQVKNDRGRHVDPFPGKRVSNMEPKRLRRLLKDKYYRTVDGLAVKQIIVHCAAVLKALGFGFKICQIEGEGDELLCDDQFFFGNLCR